MTRIFWAAIAADFVTKPRSLMERLLPSRSLISFVPKPFILEVGRLNLPEDLSLRYDVEVIIDMFLIAQNKGS